MKGIILNVQDIFQSERGRRIYVSRQSVGVGVGVSVSSAVPSKFNEVGQLSLNTAFIKLRPWQSQRCERHSVDYSSCTSNHLKSLGVA